eukprot:12097619-Alexandrium_andersonii.AAC.1
MQSTIKLICPTYHAPVDPTLLYRVHPRWLSFTGFLAHHTRSEIPSNGTVPELLHYGTGL